MLSLQDEFGVYSIDPRFQREIHHYRVTATDAFWFTYVVRKDDTYSGFVLRQWNGQKWVMKLIYSTVAMHATRKDMPQFTQTQLERATKDSLRE